MKAIFLILGIALGIDGVILSFMVNFNVGTVLVLILGLIFLSLGIYYKNICHYTKKPLFKIIKYIFIIGLCFEMALISFIAFYGHNDNVNYDEDAVIVLGAGLRGEEITLPLKYRLDEAIEYHEKNPNVYIVVSGGQGFQETVTEASAMEKYLIENGVNKEIIIKEEKATSTNENMRFSKEILDGYLKNDYKVVVVTNNFHIYRGVQIAKNEGLKNVYHKQAKLQWYNMATCYLRETLAVLKMWIFDQKSGC